MAKDDYSIILPSKIDYDELFDYIGSFGLYQRLIFIPLVLTNVASALYMEGAVFLQGIPNHRCAVQVYREDTYNIQNEAHRRLVNSLIPFTDNDGQKEYDACYYCNGSTQLSADHTNLCNGTEMACSAWVYDQSVFTSTVISDMDFVCSDALKSTYAQMLVMGGYMVGIFLFGSLSDMYGRKTIICACATASAISGICLSWSQDFISYSIIRFFNGFFVAGAHGSAFVLGIELVGPRRRVLAGMLQMFAFVVGLLFLNFVAYFERDWRQLNLIVTCPFALQVIYWWIIPQSPRWSANKGRTSEAMATLRKIAKVNRTLYVDIPEINRDKIYHGRLADLFTSRILLLRCLVMFYNWFTCSLIYYGFAHNSGNLSGDVYLDFLLGSLVEVLGYAVVLALLDRTGRKPLFISGMVIGGVACLLSVFVMIFANKSYSGIIVVALSLVGKMCIAWTFSELYIYAAEMFPTVIRASVMGLGVVFSRVGAIIAPYIVDTGRQIGGSFGDAFPMIVFGLLAVIGGLTAIVLPETLHERLPETLVDGIQLGRKAAINAKDENDGESTDKSH